MKRSAVSTLPHDNPPKLTPNDISNQSTSPDQLMKLSNPNNEIETAITYSTANTFGSHPLGIQPEGKRFFSEIDDIRPGGLGLLAQFEDNFIIDNILSFCDPQTLLNLEQTSKAMYALIIGSDVELWKEPTVELTKGDFIYQWRWRLTYLVEYQLRNNVKFPIIPQKYVNMYNKYHTNGDLMKFVNEERELYEQTQQFDQNSSNIDNNNNNNTNTPTPPTLTDSPSPSDYLPIKPIHPAPLRFAKTYPPQLLHIYPNREASLPKINCVGFFSDTLFQPWYTIRQFHDSHDLWQSERNIDRVDINTISNDEFQEKYNIPGKPVVLTNVVQNWPAVKDGGWGLDGLLSSHYSRIDLKYLCGIAHLTLDKYLLYASRCDDDDTPIYLFDKTFGETNPHILTQYIYPEQFQEDYFSFLKNHPRPPFRWWLIGPVRSSSSFHQDPLSTCAQNVLTQGLKKWIMFPPHITPPGIIASTDKLQVTAPFNAIEWYINFYKQCKPKDFLNKPPKNDTSPKNDEPTNPSSAELIPYDHIIDYPKQCSHYSQFRPVEILQRPGDCVFVPATWWHTVINLDYGCAVTQNQLTSGSLLQCEQLLTKIGQNGLKNDLLDSVEEKYPGEMEKLRQNQANRFKLLQKYHGLKKGKGETDDDDVVVVDVKNNAFSKNNKKSTIQYCIGIESFNGESEQVESMAIAEEEDGGFTFDFEDE
jgi:hypothetical protein